jgi:signal transduction histidine kinase
MPDFTDSDVRIPERVERRAISTWFMPLPRADKSLHSLPEVILLLDECGRICSVSDRHPGKHLEQINFETGATPHEALHPDCDGDDCDLYKSWLNARQSRHSELPVEWLLHSRAADTLLRFRLQPVSYACGVLYKEALRDFAGNSVLYIQDMSPAMDHLVRNTKDDDNGKDPRKVYRLRRSTDPDPHLVASLDDRLRTITSRLLASHEREGKRIARDLHDSLGQSLSLMRYEIEASLARAVSNEGSVDRSSLDRTLELTLQALGELRSITQSLHPTVIKDHGMFGALEGLCDDFRTMCPDVDLTLDLSGCPNSVPDEFAIAVYRIAQEGLNNVVRHARASSALLQCRSNNDSVQLTISDDGVGLPPEGTARLGLGLITMRERTEILGGNYSISSDPGEGCTVTLSWPSTVLESLR